MNMAQIGTAEVRVDVRAKVDVSQILSEVAGQLMKASVELNTLADEYGSIEQGTPVTDAEDAAPTDGLKANLS